MHPLSRSILWAGHVASSGIAQLCLQKIITAELVNCVALPSGKYWVSTHLLSDCMWFCLTGCGLGVLGAVRVYKLGKTEFRKSPPCIYKATRRTSFMLGRDLPMLPVTCYPWTVSNPNKIVGELQWIELWDLMGKRWSSPQWPPSPPNDNLMTASSLETPSFCSGPFPSSVGKLVFKKKIDFEFWLCWCVCVTIGYECAGTGMLEPLELDLQVVWAT